MAGPADVTPTRMLRPLERRWQDLRAGRLSIGLILGTFPTTFVLAGLATFAPEISFAAFVIGGLIVLFGTALWFLLGGWIYLLVVARLRGRIERAECLLLCVALNILLPIELLLFTYAALGRAGIRGMFGAMDTTAYLIAGSMLSLLGLAGGCIFWLLGVRPSRLPDLASVFD